MAYTSDMDAIWGADDRTLVANISSTTGTVWASNTSQNCIVSIDYSETLSSDNKVTLGSTVSKMATIKLGMVHPSYVSGRFYKGNNFIIRITCTSSAGSSTWTSPTMWIDEIEKTETNVAVTTGTYAGYYLYNLKIIAYDSFYKTDKNFSAPSGAKSDQALMYSILTACNTTIPASDYLSEWGSRHTFNTYPEGLTYREMISYIASLNGANAVCVPGIDANHPYGVVGKIAPVRYKMVSGLKTISSDEQYMDGFTLDSENESHISSIETGTKEALFVSPRNSTVTYNSAFSVENPYVTNQTLADYIFNNSIALSYGYSSSGQPNMSYRAFTVKWKGNPCIDLGEPIRTYDRKGNPYIGYVMSRNFVYDGGYYETIKSFDSSEKTVTYNNSYTMRGVDRKLSAMEEAIKDATDVITQMNGSIFELIPDATGTHNVGWKLHSSINSNVILATANGIGFSKTNGTSFDAAAIYIDSNGQGHINAEVITVDNIDADSIVSGSISSADGQSYFDLDNGKFRSVNGDFFVDIELGGMTAGSDEQYTYVSNGIFEEYVDGNRIGVITPTYSGSYANWGIYYDGSHSDGFEIGYTKNYNSGDEFVPIAKFFKPDTGYGGLIQTTNARFGSIYHQRLMGYSENDDGSVSYNHIAEGKFGVGLVNDGTTDTVAIELRYPEDSSNDVRARLDVWGNDTGTSGATLRGRNITGVSRNLVMTNTNLYWGSALVSSGSHEEYKKDIKLYTGDALATINESSMFSFKYKGENDDIPTRYGFVIERDCPVEIMNGNDEISGVAVGAIAWKAIQQLSAKVDELERRLSDATGNS